MTPVGPCELGVGWVRSTIKYVNPAHQSLIKLPTHTQWTPFEGNLKSGGGGGRAAVPIYLRTLHFGQDFSCTIWIGRVRSARLVKRNNACEPAGKASTESFICRCAPGGRPLSAKYVCTPST